MSVRNRFIGGGIIFPIELNTVTRKPSIMDDLRLIRSSIAVILNTETRRRWFNERFGTRLNEVLEEPHDDIANSLIKFFVKEAIYNWEKRVVVTNVEMTSNNTPGKTGIQITYKIRNTKIEETQIFPFYTDLKY